MLSAASCARARARLRRTEIIAYPGYAQCGLLDVSNSDNSENTTSPESTDHPSPEDTDAKQTGRSPICVARLRSSRHLAIFMAPSAPQRHLGQRSHDSKSGAGYLFRSYPASVIQTLKNEDRCKPPLAHSWRENALYAERLSRVPVHHAFPLAAVFLNIANSGLQVTGRHKRQLGVGRAKWWSWLMGQEQSACSDRTLQRESSSRHPPPSVELTLALPSE